MKKEFIPVFLFKHICFSTIVAPRETAVIDEIFQLYDLINLSDT